MKKGASTTIIMILIMLITVSLILMSYQWLLKYSPQTQQELEKNLPQKEGCLKIENIDTLNKKITIRNCGDSDLSNFIVYLDSEPIVTYSGTLNSGGITQISYNRNINFGNHEIFVSSNYAQTSKIIFNIPSLPVVPCDFYIYQSNMTNTYSVTQSNKLYCLAENININNKNAINFPSGIQNTTLDCQGYNLDGNDASNTNGIYLTGSNTKNNTVNNCNVTDFDEGIKIGNQANNNIIVNNIAYSNLWGFRLDFASFNVLINNVAYNDTIESIWSRGFELWQNSNNNTLINNTAFNNQIGFNIATLSQNNTFINNTANFSGEAGFRIVDSSSNNTFINNTASFNEGVTAHGFYIWDSSNNNVLINNIVENNDYSGIYIRDSSDGNNITGGSIAYAGSYDYYLNNTGSKNYFRNTNFTSTRNIRFRLSNQWFNYNNYSTGELWLKTSAPSSTTLTRKLINWNQTLIKWNDTPNTAVTARYNITGLLPIQLYKVYNTSVGLQTNPYTLTTDSNGALNFTINLNGNTEILVNTSLVGVTPPVYFFNSTNSTLAGTPIMHKLYWQDSTGLSGYIFSFDNCTGSLVNDTWKDFENQTGNAIFYDSFESGDFSKWNTSGTPQVTSTNPYHGTYSALFNPQGAYEYCNKTLTSSQSVIYYRVYFRTDELPNAANEKYDISRGYAGGNVIWQAAIAYYSGLRWSLNYRNGSTWTEVNSNVATINTNTWYNIELYWKKNTTATDGEVYLYVDGVEVASVTGVDTDNYGNCDTVRNGVSSYTGTFTGPNVIEDRVVVSKSYIGPDTGWSNVTKVVNSTVDCTIRWCVYANDTSNNWNYSSCINPFSFTTTSGNAAPLYFQNSTNSTIAGNPTLFSLYWTDDVGLSGYIFSTNNTGTWVNDIFTYFNITKTFGNNNNGTSSFTIGNAIMGKNYTIAENGISKSITARINTYGLARNVKCAIYDNSNNFVAETQEKSVNTGSMAWVVFNFNISNQKLLYANQLYHLVCWSNGGTDLSATYIVGENTYSQSATYGAWPKPYVPTLLSNTNKADIYVNYTPSNALFADGFESGNLNAWDGTAYSGGTLAVQNSLTYSGIYASNFTSISTDAAVAYKAITPGTDYYISSYIRLSAMPTGSSPVVLGAGFAHSNSDVPSWALIAKPIVQLQGGNLYWGVRSIYGGGTGSQNYLEPTPSKPTANTWYQVEMHSTVGTSGQFQLWVNGVLKVNQTNVDNSARGNIGTACILLDSSYGAEPAMNLYVDDVVASTSYINPENMGWSNVTKTLNSTVGSNVQWCVYANDTSNNWNSTSCVNPFSLITTSANCDNYISTIPYTINKNNTVYCLVSDLYIGSQNAINFSSGVQNSTLDCQGYNIDGNNVGYGVYLTGITTSNNIIKNCNITDFENGIYLYNGPNNNTISNSISNNNANYGIGFTSSSNNTLINITANKNSYGLYLESSSNNILINNIANENYDDGIWLYSNSLSNNLTNNTVNMNEDEGIVLSPGSNNNILINNIANDNTVIGFTIRSNNNILTNNTAKRNGDYGFYITSNSNVLTGGISSENNYGLLLGTCSNNNITGVSILNNINDYYLYSAGTTNNIINTNFTAARTIYFYDSSSWFNYRNTTVNNIWLKINVSAQSTITRKLVSWSQALMRWNDTVDTTIAARYNITGLLTSTNYKVYNNSVAIPGSPFPSGPNGQINFTINLPASKENNITVST